MDDRGTGLPRTCLLRTDGRQRVVRAALRGPVRVSVVGPLTHPHVPLYCGLTALVGGSPPKLEQRFSTQREEHHRERSRLQGRSRKRDTAMSIADVRLHSPRSVTEAIGLLQEMEKARVMAGGTDLVVDIKQGLTSVEDIISLQRIREMGGIEETGRGIRIGALVTVQEIISDSLVNRYVPALADAARSIASPQIRSVATIGGNISSAVPSADLPPSLIAAGATVELRCSTSSREVLLSEFFVGPRETVCEAAELLVSVLIPFEERVIGGGAIVLGAVAPRPVLASMASEFLRGKEPSQAAFAEAALIAREEGEPISDIRGSVWFRKELIQTLTRRSLMEALGRCQGTPEAEE
jgi:CO/xanthine dehydrogenase FAD-binding subunit